MVTISLLLYNARVRTVDPTRPCAEAVAARGDRIVGVGQSAELRQLADGGTRLIDCGGLMLTPGFIDAHAHILATARSLATLDCSGTDGGSIDAIVTAAVDRAKLLGAGGWLRGRGYHEAVLPERRHPNRYDFDRAIPSTPIRLTHASGHASVLNGAALKLLGIDSATSEPAGGRIERDPCTGEPTGVTLEMEDWLDRRMHSLSSAEMDSLLGRLSEQLLAAGVTSVHDLGHRNDRSRAERLGAAVGAGLFRPRVTMATGYDAFTNGETAVASGIAEGPVKIMLNETGEELEPNKNELAPRVLEIHRRGRQAAIHAIEPRAIEASLDAIEAAQRSDGVFRRHRIEHASVTSPALAARMAALGVVAVSNPIFLRTSGERYLRSVAPQELAYLYDVAGLRHAGVRVAAGSDCPVAPAEPLLGVSAASDRHGLDGSRLPGETLPFHEGLELITSSAAYAAFEEHDKGRIGLDMLADLVLIDDRAEQPRVMLTVLGGELAWEAAAETAQFSRS